VLAVLLTTSSAAVALPVVQDGVVTNHTVLVTIAWIAIADVATVLAIPLVMSSGHLPQVVAGAVIVLAISAAAYIIARLAANRRVISALRAQSHSRGWALDLRASLAVLFLLAWIATRFGTSVLIAGFAAGSVVALLGEPRRVAQQLIGVAEGFYVPLFFVDLGAKLDLRAFARDGRSILLAGVLVAATVLTHAIAARVWSLPVGAGLTASAQLGVPSAIASIGLASRALTPAQASAIMVAVLGSLSACALGSSLLGRGTAISDHAAPTASDDPH
jgi:Kef-type K+ transport system membrane component KefB